MRKAIDFDTLQANCAYYKDRDECQEADNFSGNCECSECPIWNDLEACEIDE